jgi:hypothetical protein
MSGKELKRKLSEHNVLLYTVARVNTICVIG